MSTRALPLWLLVAVAAAIPTAATAHPERPSYFPNFNLETKTFGAPSGAVPEYRASGPYKVVCKADSRQRLNSIFGKSKKLRKYRKGKKRHNKRVARYNRKVRKSQKDLRYRLKLLKQCKLNDIQAAVNASASGDRILILPGIYKEEPSRAESEPDPKCKDLYTENHGIKVPSYEYHYNCPNAQNLIAITGDGPDPDRQCDAHCNLQIEGMGKAPEDVYLQGERSKLNIVRADRADGIYMTNFKIEFSDFNNIYVEETNGFHLDRIETAYSREYGILSFASDHGLYEHINAYGSGDSGVYPGSGPEGHCKRYGIELRNIDSHDNNLGYSGTAGNGTWVHDSKFHDNGSGITTDSFAIGHPGMPQDCSKWENNEIYSNNKDLFSKDHQAYCAKPPVQRDPKVVCSTFQNPQGTGILIAGGNGNIVRGNYIYDNWRNGAMLHWVPAALRGEDSTGQSTGDLTNQYDTAHGNSYTDNHMGVKPDGTRAPNGTDFWWDEEGKGNCWSGNSAAGGAGIKTDPPNLPSCASGGSLGLPGNTVKQAFLVPCALWDPQDNQFPPGCDWMETPKKPQ